MRSTEVPPGTDSESTSSGTLWQRTSPRWVQLPQGCPTPASGRPSAGTESRAGSAPGREPERSEEPGASKHDQGHFQNQSTSMTLGPKASAWTGCDACPAPAHGSQAAALPAERQPEPGLLCGARLTGSCREGAGGWAAAGVREVGGMGRWGVGKGVGGAGGRSTSHSSLPGRPAPLRTGGCARAKDHGSNSPAMSCLLP